MISNDNIRPTLLEHLPVEIFQQIFVLLPLQEIVTAFLGLNSHIDSIIRSLKDISHTVRCNDVKAINLLHLFSTQISHLVIVNAKTVNFTSLINLRSLILKYGTDAQFDSIRPQHFPMLNSLHIHASEKRQSNDTGHPSDVADVENTIKKLFKVILSNGFPRLKICTAVDIGTLDSSEIWTGSPALRILHLDMKTTHDYTKVHNACPNLRRLTSFGSQWIDPRIGICNNPNKKRILRELQDLERLESKNRFILDVNPMAVFGLNKPPARFNNTATTLNSHIVDGTVIQGRILPSIEPYCHASFLIQITLPREYPLEDPDIFILDPVYHPNINDYGKGKGCRSWSFVFGRQFDPTTPLTVYVESIIYAVNNITDYSYHDNYNCTERIAEYKENCRTFYEKALRFTLSYGRPRY